MGLMDTKCVEEVTMEIRMEIYDGDLVYIINKRQIKTEYDKEVLSKAINAMCHLHCFDYRMTTEEITEVIADNKGLYVAFVSISGILYTCDYSKKPMKLKDIAW